MLDAGCRLDAAAYWSDWCGDDGRPLCPGAGPGCEGAACGGPSAASALPTFSRKHTADVISARRPGSAVMNQFLFCLDFAYSFGNTILSSQPGHGRAVRPSPSNSIDEKLANSASLKLREVVARKVH